MKKNHHNPSPTTSKNETKNKAEEKIKGKTSNKDTEDLGTMKIGKAHSMNDDDVSVEIKRKGSK